ncbi:MAG: hypothetical protein JXB26_14715 [Candidatus Aminicenantes bacterium]|nr:hypothetical protein [Candidatus Aminicenantes bacterium]
MDIKKYATLFFRWILLSAVMLFLWMFCLAAAQGIFGVETGSSQENLARVLGAMAVVSLVNTAVVVFVLLRSKWKGMKLAAVLALEVYAAMFFMGEIELLYFDAGQGMPAGMIGAHLTGGAVFAFLFGVAAVFMFGKWKKTEKDEQDFPSHPLTFSVMLLMKCLLLSIVIYPVIYFGFGYFIGWQSAAVREYYSGSAQILPFLAHFKALFSTSPLLPLWQAIRGGLWVLAALPVLRMMKGRLWEKGLAVGLIFAVLMNSQHLVPNPLMPDSVRLVHFVETTSSNFLWGWIIVWVLGCNRKG